MALGISCEWCLLWKQKSGFFFVYTVKPVLSDHVWALKKWSLNTGGLLIKGSVLYGCLLGRLVVVAQDRWSLNTSGHKTGFTVLTNLLECTCWT